MSNRIGYVPLENTEQVENRSVATSSDPPSAIADRWLSVDEVAGYLGVKRDTIYKWIDRRHMPAHKVGRLWKFRKREIDDWVCSEKDDAAVAASSAESGSAEGYKKDGK